MAPRKSEKEKELADRERLTRMSRRYHAEQLEQALAGRSSSPTISSVYPLKPSSSAVVGFFVTAFAMFAPFTVWHFSTVYPVSLSGLGSPAGGTW